MQVFKAYFKIIRKHIMSIMIYLIIFVVIAMIVTTMMSGAAPSSTYSESKGDMVIFDRDNTELSKGLRDYLSENAVLVDIPDDTQELEDALFYEKVDCVLRIPQGFTASLLNGQGNAALEKTARPGTTGSVYVGFLIERYLQMAELYVKNAPGLAEAEIVANVAKDLKNTASIDMRTYNRQTANDVIPYYFRFMAYTLLAVLLMGVTTFMMAFHEKNRYNRILCSPLKPVSINIQIALGNLTYTLAAWALMIAAVFIFYGNGNVTPGTLLLCLNSLIFAMAGLSIGFLAGKFVKSPGVQAAVTNVLALGLSFLSGVFVGQELLGKTVLDIASFTPVYWYVKAVNDITATVNFTAQNLTPIVNSMLIQMGFAVALLVIALAISKQKRVSAA